MNKQEIFQNAKQNIFAHRQAALNACEKTLAALRMHEDFRIAEQQLKKAQVAVALFGKSEEAKNVEKYKNRLEALLAEYNLTEKDIRPKFFCAACADTGYVDGKICVCLQNEIRSLLLKESNVPDANATFENSSETNSHNIAVYRKAREVCEKNTLRNILLLGKNGTGKTYLLCACANLCAETGKSVAFLTAYNLNSLFLDCHLGDLATNKAVMDSLNDVDVLVIDDLGTEITYNNVTAQYLFALLNERLTSGKQTFLSSNLNFRQLENRYDGRIFSRILDKRVSFVAQLQGDDKRLNN